MSTEPETIPVGQEPPPLRSSSSSNGQTSAPTRHQAVESKSNRKPARRKTANRFAVLNAFIDFAMGTLTRNEIAVWLVLYRDTKDGTARTSQADMARRAGVSVRTVRNALGGLAKKGLLRVVRLGGIGRGPSTYRVCSLPPDG